MFTVRGTSGSSMRIKKNDTAGQTPHETIDPKDKNNAMFQRYGFNLLIYRQKLRSLTPRKPATPGRIPMSVTLVTGGTGYIGSHCIVELLQAGH